MSLHKQITKTNFLAQIHGRANANVRSHVLTEDQTYGAIRLHQQFRRHLYHMQKQCHILPYHGRLIEFLVVVSDKKLEAEMRKLDDYIMKKNRNK